jgi:hypothetical protein
MASRAREIVDFWLDVSRRYAPLKDRTSADVLATELVRRAQDTAFAEGISQRDLEREIRSDLFDFFWRQLVASEISRDRPRSKP